VPNHINPFESLIIALTEFDDKPCVTVICLKCKSGWATIEVHVKNDQNKVRKRIFFIIILTNVAVRIAK